MNKRLTGKMYFICMVGGFFALVFFFYLYWRTYQRLLRHHLLSARNTGSCGRGVRALEGKSG